ncbi:phage head closure protein [Paraburkholderia youngii]|uniref:phage head closure protein n=1 Tax=Paraburkholderia youngii TaxID=2782701 RepID=UPI003D1E7FF4
MSRATSGTNAGGLEQRVTIQRPDVVRESSGEPVVDQWLDVATVWADITPVKGREWLASAEFRPNVTNRIRIRWLDGIDTTMRVVWGATIFDIEAVLPRALGRADMVLMCSTGMVTEGGQP